MSGEEAIKPSVLCVEDDPTVTALLTKIAIALGFDPIYLAKDGEEGFAIFTNENPDLVITDIRMEPMSGVELTRWIRNITASVNPYVPIILTSGYTSMDKILEARDAGVNEIVAKPLQPRSLFDKIKLVIEQPRPFVSAPRFFGPDRRRRDTGPPDGQERRKHTRLMQQSRDTLQNLRRLENLRRTSGAFEQ